jgi:hypothetical protein
MRGGEKERRGEGEERERKRNRRIKSGEENRKE